MEKILKPANALYDSLTQVEEDAFSATLTDFVGGVRQIYNSDLGKVRVWNGVAFENMPTSGGGYDGNPQTIVQDSTHRFTTDAEITTWNAKVNTGDSRLSDARTPLAHNHPISDITGLQTALDSKANSLGADDNYVTGAEKIKLTNLSGTNTGDNATNTQYSGLAASKQDALVSSTNIKTVNGSSILGSGNLVVASGYHFVGTLAGDQATGANVTPVTLTGLVFSYAANSTYRIWFMGRVQPTAATTGCGFQFDLSSVVTAISVKFDHQLANTGTTSGGHSIADDASVGVSSGMPGTSTYPVSGEGLLITGANAGTAQLRFRAEVAAVTTCKAGFTLVIEKIA